MKKYPAYFLFLLLMGCTVCGSAIAENFKIDELDLKPGTVDEFDRKHSRDIEFAIGEEAGQVFRTALAAKYAGYKIVGGCMGTFDRWGIVILAWPFSILAT